MDDIFRCFVSLFCNKKTKLSLFIILFWTGCWLAEEEEEVSFWKLWGCDISINKESSFSVWGMAVGEKWNYYSPLIIIPNSARLDGWCFLLGQPRREAVCLDFSPLFNCAPTTSLVVLLGKKSWRGIQWIHCEATHTSSHFFLIHNYFVPSSPLHRMTCCHCCGRMDQQLPFIHMPM